MLRELIVDDDDKINLVYGLYKLFSEIDFNGDGSMQWEEFTQFIIDSVMGENKTKDNEDEEGSGKDLSEKQLKKYKRYSMSTQIEDKSLHDTDIIDACFSPKIDKLFIVEYRSKKIKYYYPRPGHPNSGKAEVFDLGNFFKGDIGSKDDKKKKVVDSKQALTFSILSIALYPAHSVLAICTTNKKILFFQFLSDGKEEFKYEINTPTLQKKVWYLPDHNVWLSSGVSGEEVDKFDLNELDIEFEFKNQKLDILSNIGAKIDERIVNSNPYRYGPLGGHCHKEEITDLIEIRKPQLILTACMDKRIRLISLSERVIKGKH